MTIDLLYGRGTVSLAPPPGCVPTVVAKHAMPVLADPAAAVARAIGALPARVRPAEVWGMDD